MNEKNYIRIKIKSYLKKGYGPKKIQFKFKSEKINLATSEILQIVNNDEIQINEIVTQLIKKKIKQLSQKSLEYHAKKSKIFAYLFQKGHDPYIHESMINELLKN